MKKTCKFLKNFLIIAYIVLIIFITICLLSYNDYKMTVFGRNTLIPVIDKDLPDYQLGDLLIVNKNKFSQIDIGDEIFFYRTVSGETSINYAEVTAIERVTDKEFTFTVEGNYKFSSERFIGKAETATVIPKIGSVLHILQSKWGFLFLGVFPSLIAFLYTLYTVILEVREDDEDDEITVKKAKKKKDGDTNKNEVEVMKKEKKDKKKQEVENDEKINKNNPKNVENKLNIEEKKENVLEDKDTEKKEENKNTEQVKQIKNQTITNNTKETNSTNSKVNSEEKVKEEKIQTDEQKKKALIEAKMKSMTEEEKKALIQAKLNSMTEEEKRALIEAKRKKIEAEKNKK